MNKIKGPIKKSYQTEAEKLVDIIQSKKMYISFAESCTGGLAASGIVSVANASKVFNGSFVTYANEFKIKYLNVDPETIENHGVVSEEVAAQMAYGVSIETNSEIGVGISGIAGPTGGSDKKPIGTVCFGFFIKDKTFTFTKKFGNIGRNKVREEAVNFVYTTLINLLENY